jgi:hypothetical protein
MTSISYESNCAHGFSILILSQFIQQQSSHLASLRPTKNYCDLIKFEQYSSYYQKLYDSITDCRTYKKWAA